MTSPIRIPTLPIGEMVDKDGFPTGIEYGFRQALITSLQAYMGSEGLVMPVVSPTDLTTIVSAKNGQEQYTCQLGTLLYVQHPTDYTMDYVAVAVRNDNTYPVTPPIFETVMLI